MTERPRTKDDLCTPLPLLERVAKMRGDVLIDLDPCHNPWAHKMFRWAMSLDRVSPHVEPQDGLTCDWTEYASTKRPLVFVNPPYGRGHLAKWAAKIVLQSDVGCEIVSLLPHDHTTQWWAMMDRSASCRVDVSKRIAFDGGTHKTGQIRSVLFYHGPNPYLFAHIFSDLGRVHFP